MKNVLTSRRRRFKALLSLFSSHHLTETVKPRSYVLKLPKPVTALFVLFLLFGFRLNAQNTLVSVDDGLQLNCQNRISLNNQPHTVSNFAYLGNFRYEIHIIEATNDPAVFNSFEVELLGTFTSSDVNNATGGALIYKNATAFDGSDPRNGITGAVNVTGPGTYTINVPANLEDNRLGIFHLALELSEDAETDEIWFRNTMDQSNLNFTPSRNFSGSISSMTGVIDPKPVLPDNVVISDGPGVINISWDANNNEEHEFIIDPVTTAESRHIAEEGENSISITGLVPGTSHTIDLITRNQMPGCDIVTLYPGNLATNVRVCPNRPEPPVAVTVEQLSSVFATVSFTGNPNNNPTGNVDHGFVVVMREAGSPRVTPEDGSVLRIFNSHINPGQPSARVFGDFDIGNGNYNVTSTAGLDPNTSYEMDVYTMARVDIPNSTAFQCAIYSSFITTSFTTCPSIPDQATNSNATNITQTSADLSWTFGNGDGRIVVIRDISSDPPFNVNLAKGLEFSANHNFSSAPLFPGTVNSRIVYNGPNITAQVVGLLPANNYSMHVLEYSGDGACRTYSNQGSIESDFFSTISNDLIVATQNITNLTPTTGVGGGDIQLVNNVTVTEKGLVWSPSTDEPTINLSTKAIAGAGSGAFSATMTNLASATDYYVRAYAIANGNVFYGNSRLFYTLQTEPASHVTNFQLVSMTPVSNTLNSVTLSWDAVGDASGYLLVFRRDGNAPTTAGIIDGIDIEELEPPNGTIIFPDIIAQTSVTFNAISNESHDFVILPVRYESGVPTSVNYKTDGTVPTLSFVTDLTPPQLIAFDPLDNSADVSTTGVFTIQFSEPIIKGTGDIEIVNATTTNVIKTVSIASSDVTASGSTVTIDPSGLPGNTEMYVNLPSAGFIDLNGNNSQGFSGKNGWQFITSEADVTAPELVRLTPSNNTSDVSITGFFHLDFNEAVTLGTGNIVFNRLSDKSVVQTISTGDPGIQATQSRITVTPDALPAETDLYITVDDGTITDLSGNNYPGITGISTWVFTTGEAPDISPPTFNSLAPVDDQIDVALNASILIRFDEPVAKNSGFFAIKFASDGTTREVIDIQSPAVTISPSGTTVTVVPTNEFPGSTELFIEVSDGAITDVAGNSFGGFSDPTSWSFTTTAPPDGNQPQLLVNSLVPSSGTLDVPFNSNLEFTFNENVIKGTGNVFIRRFSNDEAVATINVTSGQVTVTNDAVTINPLADLPEGFFYIEIPATAFKDGSDNFYTGLLDRSWTFTTVSAPPVITDFDPLDGAVDVPLNTTLAITLSEPVDAGSTGLFKILRQDNNALITAIQPESPEVSYNNNVVNIDVNFPSFLYGTAVHVRIDAGFINDLNGNPFAGFNDNSTWNFTLESQPDVTPPQLVTNSFSPDDNAISVDPDTDLVFSFDELIFPANGEIVVRDYDTDQVIEIINVPNGDFFIDDDEVTVTTTETLGEGQFYIEIAAGSFLDDFGNQFAGLNGKDNWNFTTLGSPPAVEVLTPVAGASNVSVTGTATVTFDEPIALGSSGSIFIRRADNNTTLQTIPRTDPAVIISGSTLSINYDITGFESTEVYIQVQTGSIEDLHGNVLIALNGNVWNFTTAAAPDNNPPVLLGGPSGLSPTNGSTLVTPETNLEITFNEEIQKGPGVITIHRFTDDVVLQGILAMDPAVTIDGSVVTIDPPVEFADVQMYVLISDDAFRDNSGNFYSGIDNKNTWSFYPEIVRPTLSSMIPSNGATGVPVGEAVNFSMFFSEDIQIGAGGLQLIRVLRADNNAELYSVPLNDPSLETVGNRLSFDIQIPESEVFSETAFYIHITAQTIEDLNGNTLTGNVGSAATTGFVTELVDLTAPVLEIFNGTLFPADNALQVPYNSNLSFEFREPVVKGSGNILIRDDLNNPGAIIQTIDVNSPEVSISGNVVTVNPAEDLPEARLYAEVESGTFIDLSGNDFTENNGSISWSSQWEFTTFVEPLVVTGFSPPNGTTNVQINEPVIFEATFSHDIEPNLQNPGDILIRNGGGIVLTIPHDDESIEIDGNRLSFEFMLSSVYHGFTLSAQLQNGVVQDVDGISKSGQVPAGTWNFTMEDATPPEIISRSPEDDETNVNTDANIIASFNENVTESAQFFARLNSISGGVVEEFDDQHAGVTVSGNQLTINPTNDLIEGETYWITLNGNSVLDNEGSGNASISGNTNWNFSVGDTNAPEITSLDPADESTEVPLDANLVIGFNEPVVAGNVAGGIVIWRSNNTVFENIPVPDPRVSGLGTNSLTVNPNTLLSTSASYYVTVQFGLLEDAIGNQFPGWTDSDTWNFTASSADIINPTLVSLSPVDNETEAATNADLVIEMDENIQWSTGSILLKDFNTENLVESFGDGSGNNTISGNSITLNPTDDLASTTQYYVEIEPDAIEDLSGNDYAGFSGKSTWNFTTLNTDVTMPMITSFFPADDDTEVPEDIGELVITYDEPVVGFNGGYNLRIVGTAIITKTFLIGTEDVVVSGNTVTLKNVPQLTPHQNYYIRNVATVQDLAGNSAETWNTSETRWNFSTFSDVTAPSLTFRFPEDNAMNVDADTDILLEFSESVLPSGFIVAIREYDTNNLVRSLFNGASELTLDDNTITIDLDEDLDRFAQYYVTVTNIQDLATNPFPDISDKDDWNFIVDVIDNDPPTISTLTPPNDATNVATNIGSFSMTFSEPIFPSSPGLAIRLRRVGGNQIVQEFFLDTEDVTIDGNELTINNVEQMGTNVSYWLQGGTVLSDEAGNLLTGWVNNETTWSFTTEPTPTITDFSPASSSVDNSHTTDVVLTFNKPVVKGTGFIKVFETGPNTELFSIEVNSPEVSINNEVVTISPFNDLPDDNICVHFTIDLGAFQDENGNPFFGLNGTYAFCIESTDQTSPTPVSFIPADNSTNVQSDIGEFTMVMSEPVEAGTGLLRLRVNGTDQLIQTFDVATSDVTVDGNEVTFHNIVALTPGTSYYMGNESGTDAFPDLVGNRLINWSTSTWNFTVDDLPMLQSFTPEDNANDVHPDTDLVLNFNELVVKGTGFIRIIDASNDNELLAIDVQSPDVTVADGVATITTPLPDNNVEVEIVIDAGTFVDEFGNEYGGLPAGQWDFTIQSTDITAPFIVNVTPPDDATEVPVNSNLVIEYSEDVFLGNSSFLIRFYSNNVGHRTINYASDEVSVDGNIVTIDPENDLLLDTHFWIQINAGTITDLVGNPNAGIVIANRDDWDFVTDAVPEITSLSPQDNSSLVSPSANLVMTFTEPILKGSGLIKLIETGGDELLSIDVNSDEVTINNNVATIAPSGGLPDDNINVHVTVDEGTFFDETGNAYGGINNSTTWNFDILSTDVTSPVIVSTSPEDDEDNVGLNTNLVIEFNEDIVLAAPSGAFRIKYYNSNQTVQTIAYDSDDVVVNGNVVTIDPPIDLEDFNTRFWVEIVDNTIEDLVGNAFAGILAANKDDWDFTTGDKLDQTISFDVLTARTFGDPSFELAAESTSGLEITYSSSNLDVATVSGSSVTIIAAGTTTITASQEGNASFNPAVSIEQQLVVNKADQTITIDPISSKLTTDAAFMASASVGSGLPLTFEVSGPATISGMEITLTGEAGTVTLSVSQAGNENYNAAQAQVSFDVTSPAPVNAAPTDISLSETSLDENLPERAIIGTFSTTDQDTNDNHLYSLVTGDGDSDNSAFLIEGNELLSNQVFDFESKNSYSIRVKSEDGNGGEFEKSFVITILDVVEDVITGVDDDLKFEFKAYPNPTTDFVTIERHGNADPKALVEFINQEGILVLRTVITGNAATVDLSRLNSGLYIIRVIEENKFTTTMRLIKR